jgi:hypothetical protein
MILQLFVRIFVAFGAILALALSGAYAQHAADVKSRRMREPDAGLLHRRRATAGVEAESRDIDEMIDAIDAYRRRSGRRSIAEELSDEALRAGWDD